MLVRWLKDIAFSALPVVVSSEISKLRQNPFSEFDLDNKIVFIHIPKTAGSAILKQSFSVKHHGHFRPQHYSRYNKEIFLNSYKIAIVRNPWDRFVSAFHYLKQNVGGGRFATKFINDWLADIGDFNHFCTVMSEDKDFRESVMKWDHFRPQWDFVSLKDKYCVDLLGKYEDLDEFYIKFCDILSVTYEPLEQINSSNRSGDYRSYYTECSKELVRTLYKKDIEFFGYDF